MMHYVWVFCGFAPPVSVRSWSWSWAARWWHFMTLYLLFAIWDGNKIWWWWWWRWWWWWSTATTQTLLPVGRGHRHTPPLVSFRHLVSCSFLSTGTLSIDQTSECQNCEIIIGGMGRSTTQARLVGKKPTPHWNMTISRKVSCA